MARDNRVQWRTTYSVFGNRRYTLQLYLHFSYQCEGFSFFVYCTCNNLEIFNVARHRFLGYLRQVILSLNVRQYRSSVRQIWRKQSNLLINSASVCSILNERLGEQYQVQPKYCVKSLLLVRLWSQESRALESRIQGSRNPDSKIRGTQREYSSKPLKHSTIKRILVCRR